jgi:molybdenum cofactor cytidylyltransferase
MGRAIPAIILAAGASSRLGQPKALVEVSQHPLIFHMVSALESTGCSPIVIVTRRELLVDIMLSCPSASVVVNSNPEAGRTGSLQVGLIAIGETQGRLPKRVIICPIDRPGWSISTLVKLLSGEGDLKPAKDGRGGHPLLLSQDSIEAVMASELDEPLREIISANHIEVDDPFLHLNIDNPDDLLALESWNGYGDDLLPKGASGDS